MGISCSAAVAVTYVRIKACETHWMSSANKSIAIAQTPSAAECSRFEPAPPSSPTRICSHSDLWLSMYFVQSETTA